MTRHADGLGSQTNLDLRALLLFLGWAPTTWHCCVIQRSGVISYFPPRSCNTFDLHRPEGGEAVHEGDAAVRAQPGASEGTQSAALPMVLWTSSGLSLLGEWRSPSVQVSRTPRRWVWVARGVCRRPRSAKARNRGVGARRVQAVLWGIGGAGTGVWDARAAGGDGRGAAARRF